MASTAFQKAIAKKKNAAKLMKAANEATPGGDFSMPEIEDGTYITRVKATTGETTNKQVPFVEFKWTIVDDSPFNGKGYQKTHYLTDDDEDREAKAWERLGKDLKTLTGLNDIVLSDGSDIDTLIDQINAATPLVKTAIKNWEKDDKRGFNVYFNGIVEDAPTEQVIVKDMTVAYNGEEYVVSSVNPRERTATLRSEVDPTKPKIQNVPWGDLVA